MKEVRKDGWVLKDKDGKVVVYGQKATSFRGEVHIVEGGRPPHHAGSTGRVYTDAGEYFPSVFGMRWVEEAGFPA